MNDKEPIVYDSIISRIRSGRTKKDKEELRKSFKKILDKLDENNMLSQEGKKVANQYRLDDDFKLTSDMVNEQGKRFLDELYQIHMRRKKANANYKEKLIKLGMEKIAQNDSLIASRARYDAKYDSKKK